MPDHVEHGATRVDRSTSFTGRDKRKCSAGVGWKQQGNRVLFDIAGEAVQNTFEVILRMLLPDGTDGAQCDDARFWFSDQPQVPIA